MHRQRVELANPGDNVGFGLNIKGLDKNSLLRSGNVMMHYVESGEEDVFLPMHATSNPCTFSANENTNKSHEQS
eukprot:3878261-Karenia_brevis.AAC.1